MQYNITYRERYGKIQYIISYKDNNGKWKQKSKQGFTKKKDAKKAAEKMLDKLKESFSLQLDAELEGITLKEFSEMFLEHVELHKENNTLENYKRAFKKIKTLEGMELQKITSMHIQNCVDAMVREGLEASTIKSYLVKIKTIFNNAIEPYKIIADNPVKGIEAPKDKSNEKIKALTKSELEKLLSGITNHRHYIVSLIAAKCGLRLGEILGLTWDDIDWFRGSITVNKQWKTLKNGKWGLGSVKSKNSNRTVPAPQSVLAALKEYKAATPVSIDGRIALPKPSRNRKRSDQKIQKARFNITPHDLRHTYATLLIASE